MTIIASGSSAVVTVTSNQQIAINSAPGVRCNIEATSGVPGSATKRILAMHRGGFAIHGPFGDGTVTLYAIGGNIDYDATDPLGSADARAPVIADTGTGTLYANGSPVSGGGLAPYLGFVATRGLVPNNKHNANKQANVRTAHWARDTISPATQLQVIFGNYAVLTASSSPTTGAGVETGGGGAMTVEASIEYPAGTYTRILFSGANQGSIADAGTLISDPISINIPKDAKFFVRAFYSSAGTILFSNMPSNTSNFGTALGEGAEFAVSGASSKVMSGSHSSAGGANIYPHGFIGMTSRPSVMIYGDSRQGAQGDVADQNGDLGWVARAVGKTYAYTCAGIPSDRVTYTLSSFTERAKLAKYASHVFTGYGINDLNGGGLTGAQTLTNLQAHWAVLKGVMNPQGKLFQGTLDPSTTSSDSWATVANQTVSAYEAGRLTVNAGVRSTTYANLDGFVDIALAVESSLNSGKWQVAFGAMTADGLHAIQAGYTQPQVGPTIRAGMSQA